MATPLVYLLCIAILAALPYVLSTFWTNLLSEIMIYGIFAMSLDLILGFTGLLSLGHAAFFGLGAYTAGILTTHGIGIFWFNLAAGILIAMLVSLLFGVLVIRTRGAYFLMFTLALGQMVYAIAWQWRSFTGGDDGISGISRPDLGLSVSLSVPTHFYHFMLLFFIVAILLLSWVVNSTFGRALVGIRESETRMRALGYNTWLYKYIAYVLSAAFAGLAGVLYSYYNGFVSPEELSWVVSGQVLLMVIIGGVGTLHGPLIGAAVLQLLRHIASSYTEYWSAVIGIAYIVCVLYARNGVYYYVSKIFRRMRGTYETSED